jgi:tetratricopeptide (TPR) repeat protein
MPVPYSPGSHALVIARACLGALLSLLLWQLGMPSQSFAQGSLEEREKQAGERFERGVALYGEGNLDEALVQLERAYELVPNYKVLYNLAQIQAERHEYVAALGLFERYLEQGGDNVPEARRSEAQQQMVTLRESIVELWVEADVDGAKLYVDDELRASLPLTQPVAIDSGVRHLRIEKPGYSPVFRKLKVAGGDQPRIRVKLQGNAAAAAAGAGAQARESKSYKPFWISAGSTLALGGATLAFGLLTRHANQRLDHELDRFPGRPAVLSDDRGKVKTFAGLTDGFGIASLVSLGVSLYFLIAPPGLPADTRTASLRSRFDVYSPLARPRARFDVSLSASERDGYLGLRGRF